MKYYAITLYLTVRNTLFKLGFCFLGHLAHDRRTKTPSEKKGLNSLTALRCTGEKYLNATLTNCLRDIELLKRPFKADATAVIYFSVPIRLVAKIVK